MDNAISLSLAPELQITEWINNEGSITLQGLRGKVVVLEAFQMCYVRAALHMDYRRLNAFTRRFRLTMSPS